MTDNGEQINAQPVLNGNETVLVVDDFEEVRTLLKTALSTFGYSVICAEDGMDGLKKYTENKDKIHVMLLDIVMPKLNGIELFREINKSESNTKVLFMSGFNEVFDSSNQQDEIKCKQQNEIKCISKPFMIETLLQELRHVLDH